MEAEVKMVFEPEASQETSDYGSNCGESVDGDSASVDSDFSDKMQPPEDFPMEMGVTPEVMEKIVLVDENGDPLDYVVLGEEDLEIVTVEEEDFHQICNILSEDRQREMEPCDLDFELGAVETVISEGESKAAESQEDLNDICSLFSQKTDLRNGNSRVKQPVIPPTLLHPVLEKTLLVKLRRCDYLLRDRKRKRSGARSATNSSTSDNGDFDNKRNKDRKRRKSSLDWSIVNPVNVSGSNAEPIKLKIKRRKSECFNDESDEKRQDRLQEQLQLSPQVPCRFCGKKCQIADMKTFFPTTSNPKKPITCCHCLNVFSNTEWLGHEKRCIAFDIDGQGGDKGNRDSHEDLQRRGHICENCFQATCDRAQ